jgi:hypothetical protein
MNSGRILAISAAALFIQARAGAAGNTSPVVDYSVAQQVMAQKVDPQDTSAWKAFWRAFGAGFHKGWSEPDIFDRTAAGIYKYLHDQGKVSNNDARNVTTIIEAGRANHVDQMEIVLSRDQFVGLKGALPTPTGTAITFEAGSEGKSEYKIKVSYKDQVTPPKT